MRKGLVGTVSAPYVTARAVARLDKLARWCVPLVEPAGTLVAMKGRSAAQGWRTTVLPCVTLGLVDAVVREHGGDVLDEPVLHGGPALRAAATGWAGRQGHQRR